MSPVVNGWVEKFAHFNTCGSPAFCHVGSRECKSLKFGANVRAQQTDFDELAAHKITGFDCNNEAILPS